MKYVIIADLHCRLTNYALTVNGIPEGLYYPLFNLRKAAQFAKEHDAILIVAGDIADSKNNLQQQVLSEIMECIKEITKTYNIEILWLLGNHDYEVLNEKTYSYLTNLDIQIATPGNPIGRGELAVVAYSQPQTIVDDIKSFELNDINVIVSHLGIIEASLSGTEYKVGEFSEKHFANLKNKWIILGHYHKPQHVARNIYYVGSPTPVKISEANEEKRFLFLDTDKNEIESIPTVYPKIFNLELDIDAKINAKEIENDIMQNFNKYVITVPVNYNHMSMIKELTNEYRGYFYVKTVKPETETDEYEKHERIETIKLTNLFENFMQTKMGYEENKKNNYLDAAKSLIV